MSTQLERFRATADELASWAERVPLVLTLVSSTAAAAALASLWRFMLANPLALLGGGVVVGWLLALPMLMLIARLSRRGRMVRGLARHLQELEALRDELEEIVAWQGGKKKRKHLVRQRRVHRGIWRIGHVLEEYGVPHPNADDPSFDQWYGFLVTLAHYIRAGDGPRILQLMKLGGMNS